jgi:hypothetical protein
MRVAQILVDRSEHHSVPLAVGAWEVMVLQFEYGPEKVQVLGFKKDTLRNYPDAQSEFLRLSQRYGIDVDTGTPKAAIVFGQGAMGVMNVRNLIEAEKKLEQEEGDELELIPTSTNVVDLPQPVVAAPVAPVVIEAKAPLGLKSKTA